MERKYSQINGILGRNHHFVRSRIQPHWKRDVWNQVSDRGVPRNDGAAWIARVISGIDGDDSIEHKHRSQEEEAFLLNREVLDQIWRL
jgi:hypothetical protein